MNQQSIVMYLSLKGLNAIEIHNVLVATLKGEAESDSTVRYYLRKPSFSNPKTSQLSESPSPILNESDEPILLALSKEPFASVRQLAHRTHQHPPTVFDHLTHKHGFPVRYLRWVPHLLSEADKHTQTQFSFELFEMLQHQKDRAWYDIVTLNECWFYFTTDHERIWLPERTETPERERITVQSREMMVTIVWNPTGFHRIVALPKAMKFNADYYISHIRDSLTEWRRSQVRDSDQRLHVHADNARPHTAKKVTEFLAGNGMKRIPCRRIHRTWHRAISTFLGTSKTGSQVHHSRSPINFCRRVMQFFNPLNATLEHLFQEWMDKWGQRCVAVGGLVEGTETKLEDDPSFTRPVSRG
jgi:hypothetical protein